MPFADFGMSNTKYRITSREARQTPVSGRLMCSNPACNNILPNTGNRVQKCPLCGYSMYKMDISDAR